MCGMRLETAIRPVDKLAEQRFMDNASCRNLWRLTEATLNANSSGPGL